MEKLEFEDVLRAFYQNINNNKIGTDFNNMFKSVNPALVIKATENMKEQLSTFHKNIKPNFNDLNIYFAIGNRYASDEFYIGVISTLLWLRDYAADLAERQQINSDDVSFLDKLLDKMKIPTKQSINSPAYLFGSMLMSITNWCGNVSNNCKDLLSEFKTNYDYSSYIAKYCIGSFPAVPFTCYYLGSVSDEDPYVLMEKIKLNINYEDYMSKESIYINNPRFLVLNAFAPITDCPYSPFCENYILQKHGASNEWISMFRDSEEFNKLCLDDNIDPDDVKKYTHITTYSKHKENVENKNPIALFIEKHIMFKNIFQLTAKELEKKIDSFDLK